MKKIVWAVLLVITLTVSAFAGFSMSFVRREAVSSENKGRTLIPVERITGINAKARLRDGCYVNEGVSMPYDDNGPWIHSGRVAGLLDEIEGNKSKAAGLPVRDINIIDVYKDKCTITYVCTDDNKRYYTTDFPLAYLKYDKSKAEKADDGIKTPLPGSGFTLADDAPNIRAICILIISLGTAAVAVINLCKKEKAHE